MSLKLSLFERRNLRLAYPPLLSNPLAHDVVSNTSGSCDNLAEYGRRCQLVAPSTLFPGAQGTFSFEVLGWDTPEWKITWDVVLNGAE